MTDYGKIRKEILKLIETNKEKIVYQYRNWSDKWGFRLEVTKDKKVYEIDDFKIIVYELAYVPYLRKERKEKITYVKLNDLGFDFREECRKITEEERKRRSKLKTIEEEKRKEKNLEKLESLL